ncbi:MAG: hypothetical protein IT356_07245 [Gemmatimonadaceae bacterium]|nr:hypothetical protein [Gemmatimonadaceae bacterium]
MRFSPPVAIEARRRRSAILATITRSAIVSPRIGKIASSGGPGKGSSFVRRAVPVVVQRPEIDPGGLMQALIGARQGVAIGTHIGRYCACVLAARG